MPECTKTNGVTNGDLNTMTSEADDSETFLFTSESVGEGHPGELPLCLHLYIGLSRLARPGIPPKSSFGSLLDLEILKS